MSIARGCLAGLCAVALAGSVAIFVALFGGNSSRPEPDAARLVLWSWDRGEDLTFLASGSPTEVAFLAGTIRLAGNGVRTRPRLGALLLPSAVRRMPVVRIEADRRTPAALDATQRRAVLDAMGTLVDLRRADSLQIDFDAPLSAREFYRALLADVRASLPPRAKLSMTALASWCLGDRWLGELPVDEAVPMLFRLGRDREMVHAWLARGDAALAPECRHGKGVSLDEAPPPMAGSGSVYAFSPRPWTRSTYERALALTVDRRT
jgi:hypothetical protein